VIGKANLKAYFQRGLEAYPELQFRLENVFMGIRSVVLVYTNQKGTRTAEFMELSATGKVTRVVANYSTQQLYSSS
jgi:predicted ester cyclase